MTMNKNVQALREIDRHRKGVHLFVIKYVLKTLSKMLFTLMFGFRTLR